MSFLKPTHYYSPEIFSEEFQNIFGKQWLFACMSADVTENKDYITLEIMGKSVIIYRSRDSVKAFQNVCPHRFNRIFTEEKGNSSLVCKYHLWGFDANGKLIGKDKKDIAPSPTNLNICLKEYKITVVGKFVFINFSSAPAPIDEQLGKLQDDLLLVSEILGDKIHEGTIPHRANWKFIVENIIETQHCKALHQETLVKAGFCNLIPEEQGKVKHNSFFVIPPLENDSRLKRDKLLKKYLPRKVDNNRYKHILFFPNLTISIFEGFNITVGQLLPIDPDNTTYNLRYYTSALINPSAAGTNIMSQMKDTTISFGNQVFAEDKAVLENLQRGVKEIEHSGFIYESEARIKWFFESYEQLMRKNAIG